MHLTDPSTIHTEIAIILEAAGNSTRFGSNKLLHIMDDGRPMICSILESVRKTVSESNGSYRKILVTQYEEVADLAPDFNIVINSRPDLGITHSMQLGIEAADDADAYMFCVCDQPHLNSDTIKELIKASSSSRYGIISLAWHGTMCNPKIFSSCYRDELMALSGDTGGRQIIAAHMDDLMLVEAACEEEILDIDTPFDA